MTLMYSLLRPVGNGLPQARRKPFGLASPTQSPAGYAVDGVGHRAVAKQDMANGLLIKGESVKAGRGIAPAAG